MKTIQNISVVEDVTLVSLNDSPADMNTISKIFDMISTNNIDVDMISQTPPHSNKPHLSFTVSGDDLGKILELSAKIRELYPDIKLSVSNGNCKICLRRSYERSTRCSRQGVCGCRKSKYRYNNDNYFGSRHINACSSE